MDKLFLVILPVLNGLAALDDFTSSLQSQLKLQLQLQLLTGIGQSVCRTNNLSKFIATRERFVTSLPLIFAREMCRFSAVLAARDKSVTCYLLVTNASHLNCYVPK